MKIPKNYNAAYRKKYGKYYKHIGIKPNNTLYCKKCKHGLKDRVKITNNTYLAEVHIPSCNGIIPKRVKKVYSFPIAGHRS